MAHLGLTLGLLIGKRLWRSYQSRVVEAHAILGPPDNGLEFSCPEGGVGGSREQIQEQTSWAVRAVTVMSDGSLGYADCALSTAALPETPVRTHSAVNMLSTMARLSCHWVLIRWCIEQQWESVHIHIPASTDTPHINKMRVGTHRWIPTHARLTNAHICAPILTQGAGMYRPQTPCTEPYCT